MGSETFYCIQCGIRVSGGDLRGDRSHCPPCLGLPVEPTRDSSKRLVTSVAVRPRIADITPPKTSRTLIAGALLFVGAVLFALTTFTFTPADEGRATPIPAPPREKTASSFSQPPVSQALEKTNCSFSQEALPKPLEELRERVQRPPAPPPADPAVETLAGECYDEIEEAAAALADEGRFDDALARIRAFPAEYRQTRAWANLEGLRRQIEARARTK